MRLTRCCNAEITNVGIVRDRWACSECHKKDPEMYEIPDWERVGEDVRRFRVPGGWLYQIEEGARSYPGGEDHVYRTIFVSDISSKISSVVNKKIKIRNK